MSSSYRGRRSTARLPPSMHNLHAANIYPHAMYHLHATTTALTSIQQISIFLMLSISISPLTAHIQTQGLRAKKNKGYIPTRGKKSNNRRGAKKAKKVKV